MRPSVVESHDLPTPSIFGPAQTIFKNHRRSDRHCKAGLTAHRSDRQSGRSDRQLPKPKSQNVLGGLTATMAGQTATYLTELLTLPKTRVSANHQRHCQLTHHPKIWSISPWYPQSPPWWTHWQLSRKCSFEVWKRVYSQFSHKGTTWSISKRKQWKWPSWHQNSIGTWDKAKESMKASNSRKESKKNSLKVHMKEQLFIWPLIIVRNQELQFKFREGNKIITMQIWYSPSLWSPFF